jgi:DNA-directed RNA polymerase specialized sigma24 family protein
MLVEKSEDDASMSNDPASVKQRWPQITQGDLAAWREFVSIHIRAIAGYLGCRIAEMSVVRELTIKTFARAFHSREGLPMAQDDAAAWLRKFAATVAREWADGTNRPKRVSAEFPVERCSDDPQLFRRLNVLHQAMYRLDVHQRKALEYGYRGGMNGPALARALRCQPDQVQVRLRESMTALELQLAADRR